MSVASSAQRTARRAGDSTTLELVTRAGFVGYGLFHLAVAWLALQIALAHPAGESDQSGAFQVLLRQPLGRILLWLIVGGLAAMALWQLLEAAVGHRAERGTSRIMERLASVGRVLVYSALAWTAYRTVSGVGTSSAAQQRAATAGALAHPAGRWLVAAAGVAIVALGVGMVVYGAKRKFEKRLKLSQLTGATRRVVVRSGQLGYLTKGFAYTIVGVLGVTAALKHDAAKSTGLDGALRELVAKPFGELLLAIVAAGFAAHGLYCFFQARYRKV